MTTYEIGDMFWGKSQSYPWWPCLIMTNNNNEIKRTRKKIGTQYHVQFIGPYYDACWITNNFLIPYDGIDKFESYVEQQLNSSLPAQHKLIFEMKMSGHIQSMWIQACHDAERIIQLPNLNRIQHLPKLETMELNVKKPKIKKRVPKPPSKHSDSDSVSDSQMADNRSLDVDDSSVKEVKMSSDIEEICYRVYLAEEMENRLKNAQDPIDQAELEQLLKQQWSVLDIEARLLYSDGDKLNISKSRVSGRKIKVPSRLRRTNELEDIKKATLKKRNSDMVMERKRCSADSLSNCPSATGTCDDVPVEAGLNPPVLPSIELSPVCRETMESSLLKSLKVQDSSMEIAKFVVRNELPVVVDICHQCLKPYKPMEKSKTCKGDCQASFHFMCALQHKLFRSDENSKCINCVPKEFFCCICKNSKYMKKQSLMKCKKPNCPLFFHSTCLRFINFIDLSMNDNKATDNGLCPSHSCLTCNREDSRHSCNSLGSLVTCTRCPIAYHSSLLCIPAGSRIISSTKIICHRHFDHEVPTRNRLTRCFVCFLDNATLCCCRCRAVFHPKCINMPTYTDLLKDYVCPTCKLENPIFYGQIMWIDIDNKWVPVEIIAPYRDIQSFLQPLENKVIVCTISFESTQQRRRLYHNADPSELVPFAIGESALKDFIDFDKQVMEQLRNMNTIYFNWRKWMRPFQSEKLSIINPSELIRSAALVNGVIGNISYEKINENQMDTGLKSLIPKTSVLICSCSDNGDHLCDNHVCYNYVNKIECSSENCKNSQYCTNRRFTKGFSIQPTVTDVQVISGKGVRFTDSLNKGSLVGELVGRAISVDNVIDLMNNHAASNSNRYIFHLVGNIFLNCEKFGNEWRHLNHSCNPNAELVCWNVSGEPRLGVSLLRTISDEEITINYQKNGFVVKYEFQCKCQSKTCCKKVGPTSIFSTQSNFIVPRCCIDNNIIEESTINGNSQSVISCRPPSPSPTKVVIPHTPTKNQLTTQQHQQQSKTTTQIFKSERKIPSETMTNQNQKTVCHRCNTHGELICCNKAQCTKRYHLQCVEIAASPKGIWFCPKHYCVQCGHAAVSFCSNCCTSFCKTHLEFQNAHKCSDVHIIQDDESDKKTSLCRSHLPYSGLGSVPPSLIAVEIGNSDNENHQHFTDNDKPKNHEKKSIGTVDFISISNVELKSEPNSRRVTKSIMKQSHSGGGIVSTKSVSARRSDLKTVAAATIILKAEPIPVSSINKKDLYSSCDLIPKVLVAANVASNNDNINSTNTVSPVDIVAVHNRCNPDQVNLKILKRHSDLVVSTIENSKRARLTRHVTCNISNYLSTDEEFDANPEPVEKELFDIRSQVIPMGIEDMENLIISPIILDD